MSEANRVETSEPLGYNPPRSGARSDVDEWTEREHRRRQAWLAGPSEAERYEYAVRSRGRTRRSSLLGFDSPSIMLTDEEVDEWAEREAARRRAWVDGPTQTERLAYARRRSALAPGAVVQDDVDEWAEREHERRAAWASGPTENEKRDWLMRHRRRVGAYGPYDRYGGYTTGPETMSDINVETDLPAIVSEIRQLATFAAVGATYRALEYPYEALGQLVRAGLDLQESLLTPRPYTRRVPF